MSTEPNVWPRDARGRRFSAWRGAMEIGRVTIDGHIVGEVKDHGEASGFVSYTLFSAGQIAMMREHAEIAAEHGWTIVAPCTPGLHFDTIVTRHA